MYMFQPIHGFLQAQVNLEGTKIRMNQHTDQSKALTGHPHQSKEEIVRLSRRRTLVKIYIHVYRSQLLRFNCGIVGSTINKSTMWTFTLWKIPVFDKFFENFNIASVFNIVWQMIPHY